MPKLAFTKDNGKLKILTVHHEIKTAYFCTDKDGKPIAIDKHNTISEKEAIDLAHKQIIHHQDRIMEIEGEIRKEEISLKLINNDLLTIAEQHMKGTYK